MAAMSYKRAETNAVRPQKAIVRLANAEDDAAQSPALQQQARLEANFEPSGVKAKWSPRRTLAFAGLTCGGFWLCLLIGITRAAH